MKNLNKKAFGIIATLMTVIAASVASSACYFFLYQPKEPKSFREE